MVIKVVNQESGDRHMRQMAGFLKVRFGELGLYDIYDPRGKQGHHKWELTTLVKTILVGMGSGCKSLRDTERRSTHFNKAICRLIGTDRRVPDTTMRDLVCELSPDDIRQCIKNIIDAAEKQGILKPAGLPIGIASMDGKYTTLPISDDDGCVQSRTHEATGASYGMIRTMTAMLISAMSRPVLDAEPIPASTNEAGHFQTAFAKLCASYGHLFELLVYDAGITFFENAWAIVKAGKHYLLHVKNECHEIHKLIVGCFESSVSRLHAETTDIMSKERRIIRRATVIDVKDCPHLSWEPGFWSHAKALVKVESFEFLEGGVVTLIHERFYISSLPIERLSAEQWLEVIRRHWSIENNGHHTLDVVFQEDKSPWITHDSNGTLVLLLLRRLMYNLVTMFRCFVSENKTREKPWKDIIEWILAVVMGAGEDVLLGLRPRRGIEESFSTT